MTATVEEKGLIVPLPTSALEVFKEGGLNPILVAIEEEVKNHTPDLTTNKGRSEIASLAHKVARSKTYLDNLGKDLVSEWKKKSSSIDAERKRMREKLDALKNEVRSPLDQWEEEEKQRVYALRERIDKIHFAASAHYESAEQIQNALDGLLSAPVDESMEELQSEAQIAFDYAVKTLESSLLKQREHEEAMAELERLRKEEEARKAKEAEEARLREEAERKAREEKEREEREARIRAEAEANAKREAEMREANLRAEKERLESEANEAKERAVREKRESEERAKQQAEEAARAEREKIEREKQAEDAERKRREESTRIRNNVRKKAVAAMVDIGLDDDFASDLFDSIDEGAIPNIYVRY